MAFGQGKVSNESSAGSFKRYAGVAAVKVLAVNPNKEEWENITGSTLQKEPEYVSVAEDGTKQARIVLLLQPDATRTVGNIETVIPVTFWFKRKGVQSKTGKWQVIDKYGRTAWVTPEELSAHAIPQYSTGPADIDKDYRQIVDGEEAFTNFLKALLDISSITYFDTKAGVRKTNEHPEDCEARLDNLGKIFEGDFSEIKTIIGYQPNNYCKMLFGVKTTDDGKEYQDVFMGLFLTNRSTNTGKFATELKKATDLGRYPHTYFGEVQANGEILVELLHERVVTPTEFKEEPIGDAPFGAAPQGTFDASKDNDLPF